MSSPQAVRQNSAFQNRLNRVAERRAPHEAAKPQIDVLPDWKENAFGPAGIAAAVVVGLLSVLIVRIALFHITGTALVSDTPALTQGIEFAASFGLSAALFFLLPWKGVKFYFLQFAGVAFMILTMHNMVHSSPGLYGLLFSQDWTDRVLAETEASSMHVIGKSLPFAGKITEEGEETAKAEAAPAAQPEPEAAPAPQVAAPVVPEPPKEPELPRRIELGRTSLGN